MKSTQLRLGVALVLLAAAVVPGAAAGERMSGGELDRAFTGITLDGIYFNRTYFTEVYNEDRTIRYWDAAGADSGRWSIRDGLFCTFYEGQQGACFLVERDGDNCFTFFELDEDDRPLADWTSRGWNRDMPPTCPTPPAAAI